MKRHGAEAERMGRRLQELRHAAGLSQSQLARAAGIPVSSLKNWEQGQRLPRIDLAYKLAKSLKITVDELIGETLGDRPTTKKRKQKGK